MSVECPASGCGYSGTLDAVEGHIGGVAEGHEGVAIPDLRESLHGKASEGVAVEAFAGLVLAVIVVLWFISQDDGTGENQPDEGDEAAEGW